MGWWASKTNFGENEITVREMADTLLISKNTANTLIKNIKKENEKQGKNINSKGENTKEKVKNWFLKHGNYRGSNNDCSRDLNTPLKTIERIKNNLKKEGIILP